MQGFKTATREAEVGISLVTQSDFTLQPGQVTETIEISGVAPLVETSENRLSTLFVSKQVEDLPNNGRDFNNLLDGVPGVQRSPGGGFLSLNINGQRATSNNFAVDGIPNNDRYYGDSSLGQVAISGTAAALIPLEGLSEFSVQSKPVWRVRWISPQEGQGLRLFVLSGVPSQGQLPVSDHAAHPGADR